METKNCYTCKFNNNKYCGQPIGNIAVNKWLFDNQGKRDKNNIPISPDSVCPGYEPKEIEL